MLVPMGPKPQKDHTIYYLFMFLKIWENRRISQPSNPLFSTCEQPQGTAGTETPVMNQGFPP